MGHGISKKATPERQVQLNPKKESPSSVTKTPGNKSSVKAEAVFRKKNIPKLTGGVQNREVLLSFVNVPVLGGSLSLFKDESS
jgi:hypothetical protein